MQVTVIFRGYFKKRDSTYQSWLRIYSSGVGKDIQLGEFQSRAMAQALADCYVYLCKDAAFFVKLFRCGQPIDLASKILAAQELMLTDDKFEFDSMQEFLRVKDRNITIAEHSREMILPLDDISLIVDVCATVFKLQDTTDLRSWLERKASEKK